MGVTADNFILRNGQPRPQGLLLDDLMSVTECPWGPPWGLLETFPTKMAVVICISLVFFLAAFLSFLYRKFRLPKLKADLAKSFLRNYTSDLNKPAIIAHRGGSSEAPENTLAAFRTAKDNGATGVEFDVDFTKDGRAVVIHDSTVDRTTDGSGPVNDFTFEEIRKLDASAKHRLR